MRLHCWTDPRVVPGVQVGRRALPDRHRCGSTRHRHRGPAIRHQHDASRQGRGLHPPRWARWCAPPCAGPTALCWEQPALHPSATVLTASTQAGQQTFAPARSPGCCLSALPFDVLALVLDVCATLHTQTTDGLYNACSQAGRTCWGSPSPWWRPCQRRCGSACARGTPPGSGPSGRTWAPTSRAATASGTTSPSCSRRALRDQGLRALQLDAGTQPRPGGLCVRTWAGDRLWKEEHGLRHDGQGIYWVFSTASIPAVSCGACGPQPCRRRMGAACGMAGRSAAPACLAHSQCWCACASPSRAACLDPWLLSTEVGHLCCLHLHKPRIGRLSWAR